MRRPSRAAVCSGSSSPASSRPFMSRMRKPVGRSPSGAVIEAFWSDRSPSVPAKAWLTWTWRHSGSSAMPMPTGINGQQRLELGDAVAQIAVRLGQSLLADAPDPRQLQHRADAGAQLAAAERLGQVVVGPGLQAGDAGILAGAGRDQDHGDAAQRGVGADRAQQLEAVEPRHHHVGEQQVGRLAPDGVERRQAVGDGFDAAGRGEQAADVVAHVGVVVGEDDPRPAPPSRRRRRRPVAWPAAIVRPPPPSPRRATRSRPASVPGR